MTGLFINNFIWVAILSLHLNDFVSPSLIKEVWVVKSNSSLKIDGKTNINSFSCTIDSYGKNDTLICQKGNQSAELFAVSSTLIIPVDDFDCHHRIMTKDLQKTLKSDQFPYMLINFKHFSRLPSDIRPHTEDFYSIAEITLAGSTKKFTIYFKAKSIQQNTIELVGQKIILFSDFHLKPPSKLGGTIKVRNELDVQFNLNLKRVAW